MNKKQLLLPILVSFLLTIPSFAQDKAVEGELSDNKKKAEVLFEKGKSLFEKVGSIFSLKTTTEYLLEAIELDPDNKKYKEVLCNLYDSYWNDDFDYDYAIEALRLEYEGEEPVGTKEDFEREVSDLISSRDLQKRVKSIVEKYRNDK